jgi:hypothetical protein
MKNYSLLLFLTLSLQVFCQKIEIPRGVVYHYCDSATFENAKAIVMKDLTNADSYEICDNVLFIGPVLWARFEKIKSLKKIEGGNVTLLVDDKQKSGKMTQDVKDTKEVLNCLRKEVTGNDIKLRKATKSELLYYWSVISFDIDEPLIILETKEHRYILNLAPKTMKLVWLDEAP